MLDMRQPEKKKSEKVDGDKFVNFSWCGGGGIFSIFCLCGEGLANLVDCERNEKIS